MAGWELMGNRARPAVPTEPRLAMEAVAETALEVPEQLEAPAVSPRASSLRVPQCQEYRSAVSVTLAEQALAEQVKWAALAFPQIPERQGWTADRAYLASLNPCSRSSERCPLVPLNQPLSLLLGISADIISFATCPLQRSTWMTGARACRGWRGS
jgi:hypothetical protein